MKSQIANNTKSVFFYRKSERIVSAVYVITNLIDSKDPLKWKIRDVAVELMTEVLPLNDNKSLSSVGAELKKKLRELSTLIGISSVSGLISSMNVEMLNREIKNLSDILDESPNILINGSFFNITDIGDYNGHSNGHSNVRNKKEKQSSVKSEEAIARRKKLMEIIKRNKEVSVSEASLLVAGVSEKTIQRDLQYLEDSGLLKHRGEKRWRKYIFL